MLGHVDLLFHWQIIDLSLKAPSDGRFQSPINIVTSQVEGKAYRCIQMSATRLHSATFQNNGITVLIQPDDDSRQVITGGPMGDQFFKLEEFHFHSHSQGGDHSIDGKRYTQFRVNPKLFC